MLDAETKARIDSARDILVGKVPDPKSQVEQITIALIYKFMDDMDRQSEELGGKVAFFTGEFKKYRWSQLLDKRMGGHERLLLYAEGIEKMNENAGIPQLFRDIFKGVFLPYRDPETLNLFLKEINSFSYDHSERLGDAFEYLLSVLGTQGDAGQFRTPRHIIDFIVSIVEPQKNETVLDPACGTAGFLISAYKHIVQANKDMNPDERARLMTNFAGYDIAPDMCRLSRVNMYLHGFPSPTIHEYDALSSEERWDERFDVILANPPFMTPKGGIRPHNRFAVKAKRSEVLFVDYIAEHLNPGSRAGVIVPEGIIFQAQNAYKNLRRMLVENHLWAVVSLPAGVFNPYSGVKTSILFFDKNMAKRVDDVLFVKIANDGFDLGAQRRPIEGSELPNALKVLQDYKQKPKAIEDKMALTVQREALLDKPDCGFEGDRYRAVEVRENGQWPMVSLEDVCEIKKGSPITKKTAIEGNVPVIAGGQQPAYYHNSANRTGATITVSASGAYAGFINYFHVPIFASDCSTIKPNDEKQLHPKYLYYILKSSQDSIYALQKGGGQPHVYPADLAPFVIPLPPLEEQERIVAELDGYRKVIDGARQVVENYKPSIQIDPDWPVKPLEELIADKPKNGYSGKPVKYLTNTKVLSLSATTTGELDLSHFKYLDEEIAQESPVRCRKGDILLQRGNTRELVGTAALFDVDDTDYIYPDLMIRVRADESQVISDFLIRALQSPDARSFIMNHASGSAGSMPKINQQIVKQIPIPVPPLKTQRDIVAAITSEIQAVKANRELIGKFEKRIENKLSDIWGES